jgi:hypothetical protein
VAGGPGVVSNTRIANVLRLAAVDRGTPGVDSSFGHGVVDALAAVQALSATTNTPPRSVIDSPGADLIIPPNTSVTFQGSCVDIEGDQPFTFAWNFSGVAPPTTVQNPGDLISRPLGLFPSRSRAPMRPDAWIPRQPRVPSRSTVRQRVRLPARRPTSRSPLARV